MGFVNSVAKNNQGETTFQFFFGGEGLGWGGGERERDEVGMCKYL